MSWWAEGPGAEPEEDRLDVATRILILTLGGACGVNARYWLSLLLARWVGARFPWATVLINVSGSFLIGLGAMVLAVKWPHPYVRIFAMTGVLGGYTTFSAYMFETFTLWERGDRTLALVNVVGSVVLGLLAVGAGVATGRWLAEPPVLTQTKAATITIDHRLEGVGEALAGSESDG